MSDISRLWLVAASVTIVMLGAEEARSQTAAPHSVAFARRVRLETIARTGNTFTARLEGGATAELTLDARLAITGRSAASAKTEAR